MKIIHSLPPKLPPNIYIGVDSEWFRLNEKTMHRPTSGKFACMTMCYQPGEVYYIDDPNQVQYALNNANDAIWLIQHAKFDITHMRRLCPIPPRNKLIDTMLMERILWNGYYESFGQESMTRRYLREHLDKKMQRWFATADQMTPEAIEYACKDADTLLRIWNEQKKHITTTDMKIWREVDLPALWAVLDFQGFRIDVDAWEKLAVLNKERGEQLKSELPVNPGSYKKFRLYLQEHGFPGITNTQEDTLVTFIRKYPDTEAAIIAQKSMDCRGFLTLSSRYGKNVIDDYAEWQTDGGWAVYGDYSIIGAETGRFSCSDPNIQNIPSRDTKEFRKCFIASPNHVLVIADYSAQEPFLAAYISQDRVMLEICNSEKDIYIETAKLMFNEEITKDDPRRQQIKTDFLGADYGMSKYGLAAKEGIEVDEAEERLDKFRHIFPQLALYMDKQQKEKRLVRTVLGRKAYLNPYVNQCPRNALNAPIQGSAADMSKLALGKMHKEWPFEFPFGVVAIIHDEFVLDVPENSGQEVADFVQKCMVDAADRMCFGMKFRATVSLGNNWSEK